MHTEVDVRNPDHLLVPGLYAEADLTLEHKEDIPAIPLEALNHEGNKTTVFVVNENHEVEDRPVSLGIETANDAEVVAGLHDGEMVVVSDRAGLKPGEKVVPQVIQVMQYHENSQE
jgi:multidrug efflux pump subunit AcrA (membrane-fusion protein)